MITQFKRVTPETYPELRRRLSAVPHRFADFTALYQLMWSEAFDTRFGCFGGVFMLSARETDGSRRYAILLSPLDDIRASSFLTALCKANGGRTVIGALTEEEAARYAAAFPGESRSYSLKEESDYLYDAESLRTLGGRKLSAKRNHINAFLTANPDYAVVPLSEENLGDARRFLADFRRNGEDETPSAKMEGDAASRLLSLYPLEGLSGLLLYAGGAPIGLSLYETRGDTLYMHIEKAYRAIRGAYPLLARETARAAKDAVFANREEDDGDIGLRLSKESYRPIALLDKYTLELSLDS